MHIVYLTTDFVENNGPTTGLPKYLYRVSKVLTECGHKVSVITCSNRSVYYEFFGIHVYHVRRPAIKAYGNQKKDAIANGLRDGCITNQALGRIYKNEKIDIVQYTSLNGLAYYHNLSIPAVTRLSSYAPMWPLEGQEESIDGKAILEREAAIKCDAVFAPSFVVAKRFSKDIGRKVDVIETPFVMEEQKEDYQTYNDCFWRKKYFLFYGTLIKYKGLTVIADAAYEVLDNYRDIYIGIIGNGNKQLVSNIKQKAGKYADRIIYHSAVGFAKLKPIIRNAEAVILPSLMENFSNACVESMALGQIVIGTNGASFEQLIEDGKNGFLCEIGDPKSLIKAVHKVMSLTLEEKESIRSAAISRTDLLSPQIVVKKLLNYYESIIRTYMERHS